MNGKRLGLVLFAGVIGIGLWSSRTIAETTVIEDVKEQVNVITGNLVDFDVLVATDYFYSFNTPGDRQVPYTVIERAEEQFLLNDAFLQLRRMREDEDWGFTVNMDFGETAEVIAARDPNFTNDDNFELREAFGIWKTPLADITLKAGKFVTLLGYEVLKTPDNINHNITNSILFGYAIPFTHVGMLANAPLGDYFSLDMGLVDGWDNYGDTSGAITFLGGLAIKPADIFSMYVAGTCGSDQNPINQGGVGTGSHRGVITLNAVLKATDALTFVLDSVYGSEGRIGRNGTTAVWRGIAGYGVFDWEQFSFAFRAEVFDDPDGVRNFTNKTGDPVPATLWEITPTVTFRVNDHIVLRAEYRHDNADKNIFPINERDLTAMQSSDPPNSQIGVAGSDLIGAEFLLLF